MRVRTWLHASSWRFRTGTIIASLFVITSLLVWADSGIRLFPNPGDFDGPVVVYAQTGLRNVTLHYTLDGSEPTIQSPRYSTNIRVNRSQHLRIAAFNEAGEKVSERRGTYLVNFLSRPPEVELAAIPLDSGSTRFEATVSAAPSEELQFQWFVDSRLQAGETGDIFVADLRREFDRTATISVRVTSGRHVVTRTTDVQIAALPVDIDLGEFADYFTSRPELVRMAMGQPNLPPSIRLRAPFGVLDNGEEMVIQAQAQDPENDPLEYLWIVNGEVAQFGTDSTLEFARSPERQERYTVLVAVSDGLNVVTSQIPLIVNEPQPEAVLSSFEGDVQILSAEGQWRNAVRGMSLALSDTINTGFGASAQVTAGDSRISLQPMTRITLDALSAQEGQQETSLFLRIGSVTADVDSSRGVQDFSVVAPHATASVRGTSFTFDGTNVRVHSGSVAVRVGPPQRNIQRLSTPVRGPVEASSEPEEESQDDTAGGDGDDESESDAVAEESEDGDEILVGEGESLAIDLDGLDVEGFDMPEFFVEEYRIPEFATVNVFLNIEDIEPRFSEPVFERAR